MAKRSSKLTKDDIPAKDFVTGDYEQADAKPAGLNWEKITTKEIAAGLRQHGILTYEDLRQNVGPAVAVIRTAMNTEYSKLLIEARKLDQEVKD